ncbi:winged helix DNA-binding domain-containing protein [Microbacteriaceae bacterium VKM Ac-2855]|nr:winged helix DNA-binding domain-containing protein [Microbacteriaceae bacterium VKM Ac-2855]
MLALQGQDPASMLWSIGLRAADASGVGGEGVVRAAFDRGELVRSWTMRGTLHATTPADLVLLLSVTAERQRRAVLTRQRSLGVSAADIAASEVVARAVLADGAQATRAELYAAWQTAGQATSDQRGYHLIYALALEQVLCLGPFRGTEQCFVLADDWLPDSPSPDAEDAAMEIARRYFSSHGPATERDLANWLKIPLTTARAAMAALGDELQATDGPTGVLWATPERWESTVNGSGRILLLPGFDEMLLGYADRSASLPSEFADRIVPGGNGIFLATILRDGRVVGTWRRRTASGVTAVTPDPFLPLSPSDDAGVVREAKRYARFLGTAVPVG